MCFIINNLLLNALPRNLPPLLLWLIVIMFNLQARAQEAHFSQYYATPTFLNPALSGLEKDVYFGSSYRSQWKSLDAPYETYQFTFIHPIYSNGSEKTQTGGMGISVYRDKIGENGSFKTDGIFFTGSYNLRFDHQGRNIISLGLKAGFIKKSIDLGNLHWGSQYNTLFGYDNTITPEISLISDGVGHSDFGAGIVYYFNPYKLYYFKKYSGFLGLSVENLNKPNESLIEGKESHLPMLFKIHGGMEMRMNSKILFAPNVLLMHQGTSNQLNFGAYLTYKLGNIRTISKQGDNHLILGGWYRWGDAFIFSTGFTLNSVSLGFSYDFNVSTLSNQFNGLGAYELSVSYRINKGKGIKRFSTPLI